MTRSTTRAVDAQFLERWSPRAFDGSEIDEETLFSLIDAARWAPSAYNYQPWRFVWARRGDAQFPVLLDLLLPFNAGWAGAASAILFVLSDTLIVPPGSSDAQPASSNSFDAGAAWAQLALQAHLQGLVTHAMGGFDHDRAPEVLGAGDRYKVEAAIAIGRRGDKATLPEVLQAREAPSPRKSVEELAFHGRIPA